MPRTKLADRFLCPKDRGQKALVDYISSNTGKNKKMTQEDFAEAIGLSAATLSKRMNGRSKFTLKDIITICWVLDPPEEIALSFLGRTPKKNKKSA